MFNPKIFIGNPSVITKKGWGSEETLVNNEEYCAKYLFFNKGSQFSSHYHINKRETFIVLSGRIKITGIDLSDASTFSFTLTTGGIVEVPRFAVHQVMALEDSKILEVSTHHEDSDSYRVFKGDSQK